MTDWLYSQKEREESHLVSGRQSPEYLCALMKKRTGNIRMDLAGSVFEGLLASRPPGNVGLELTKEARP